MLAKKRLTVAPSSPASPAIAEESAEESAEAEPVEIREAPRERAAETSGESSDLIRRYRAVIEGSAAAAEGRDEPRSKRRLVVALVLLGVAAALLGGYVSFLRHESEERSPADGASRPEPRASDVPATSAPAMTPPPSASGEAVEEKTPPGTSPNPIEDKAPPQVLPEPKPVPPRTATVVKRTAEESSLSISEMGVGRKIAHHRLEGAADRFSPGDLVFCATRVRGGKGGTRIRHVWLHEGKASSSVTLPLGGADWFTYSNKRVGARGAWTVEARDDGGRVLERVSFTCE
jgi:hypothetical protein